MMRIHSSGITRNVITPHVMMKLLVMKVRVIMKLSVMRFNVIMKVHNTKLVIITRSHSVITLENATMLKTMMTGDVMRTFDVMMMKDSVTRPMDVIAF
jgi:hypothetical protein